MADRLVLVRYSVPSFIINLLSSIFSDHDLLWETASSSDNGVYDPLQIHTRDGSLLIHLDNFQSQDRQNKKGCTGDQVRKSGWGWVWGVWKGGNGAKERHAIYTDRSLSGMLKLKVPLCLNRGGLIEVGLGKMDFGSNSWSGSGLKRERVGNGEESEEGTMRRLIFVRTISSLLPS